MKCTACNIDKLLTKDNFQWRKDNNKWIKECKTCISIKRKQHYLYNKDKIIAKRKTYILNNHNKYKESYIKYNNKQETKIKTKVYRQLNKKKFREKEKLWRQQNPIAAKLIARRKAKVQRKKAQFKLRSHISRQVNFALKRKGFSKCGESVIKYLPYTIDQLKAHLEFQFEPWMNWNNYGIYNSKTWNDNDSSTWTWQIDHIIPQSTFNYLSMTDADFFKCWSLNNLRPLNAKQNIMDGSNRLRH